jgi:hypothetical protein
VVSFRHREERSRCDYSEKKKEPASLAANLFAVPGSSVRALYTAKCIRRTTNADLL